MKWALVDGTSIIKNLIMYDGTSEYQAPAGQTKQQVNDWLTVGDNINAPQLTDAQLLVKSYTLSQRKELCVSSLMQKRISLLSGGYTYNGKTYPTDAPSIAWMELCLGAYSRAILPTLFNSFSWVLKDGTVATVSYADANALSYAIAAFMKAVNINYATLAAAINASTSPETVNINTGWPAASS